MTGDHQVMIGNTILGRGFPILIQTMYDSALPKDIGALDDLLRRIGKLNAMGCDIIRFSYPSKDDHASFAYICKHSPIPVVADIHFDYQLALDAIACGCRKIRINPGNIGSRWKVDEVVKSAKDHNTAIRIGLNSGSLPKGNDPVPILMCNTALTYLSWFEQANFTNTVVSLKASDTEVTLEANRLFASLSDYPLHLGVTEAGSVVSAITRSTWALGQLLSEGIGNTLRISITGEIETEVQAGVELLRTLGLRKKGIRVVSCPRCGRHSFDSQGFLQSIEADLLTIDKDLTVAIMGCQVNGPGEAKAADLAITGIGNSIFLYEKGVLVKKVTQQDAKAALLEAIEHAK
ncbi:MAG: flavodoxin-dependent (E)-4-hydroxy-3-methylbut-2-enyl-diphosphate synthase [Sphaerochaeta sp.]|uniref:flavodoxin-dependent (E)-4-hydroxy-3-methylbut-2-enyl-diphosphate synthase n=1 Tax=Sphaerochaeta sp. TaxID=1972642 RepID=UPI002A36FA55|nr:flavodoxin-dependent (E)-4-hydroxy-3-methylbut-2-enyl-diphosphate synthase [Sphaerochaeta sp.]MCK9602084.1 flavodoxin-dependent (E)-4-hydroxy-3-methylbut-2-enyl-diphosphate synthase [Sphaerochaeta sp.]MDX9823897.1 flavodoxin-dependent (E)-4-hydroxy-3-methylbut-2-enyl-diphosphate synthase [Sphaerochaeta sp.]HPE92571.1 flavodoxin-dependent (E)-4-hydroxy-3-methylbut-2-enyl-diphosphate synthase [Sphaerochaeta sp.]